MNRFGFERLNDRLAMGCDRVFVRFLDKYARDNIQCIVVPKVPDKCMLFRTLFTKYGKVAHSDTIVSLDLFEGDWERCIKFVDSSQREEIEEFWNQGFQLN